MSTERVALVTGSSRGTLPDCSASGNFYRNRKQIDW
jgi:hypothetical protein